MKGRTKGWFDGLVRMAWLVATLMASLLAITLLFGAQEVIAARPGQFDAQPSGATTQRPSATTTTLLVGTSPNYWPMEYISGTQIVGHDIDLMNAVAGEMGVTVIYISVPFNELFGRLMTGAVDAVISSVSITPARQEFVDFSLPYCRVEAWAPGENVAIVVQEGNTLLRRQINEALWKLRNDGTLEANIAAIAADVPEWQPELPDWPYISPGAGTTLVYTDAEELATIIQVPGGAVTETILTVYTPLHAAVPPPGLFFAGRAFDLDVYRHGQFLSLGIGLSVPATITIHYAESDVIGRDEESLRLGRWNGITGAWENAACGPHGRHTGENWLAVPVCHLSRFALFGEAAHTLYLPLVLRNAP